MPDPASPYSDLRGKTVEQLLEIKLELESSISIIRTRIRRAQADVRQRGTYADESWWIKAHQALRIKGKQCQQIQNELGRRRRLRKDEKIGAMNKSFISVARRRLPEEQFKALLAEALLVDVSREV